MSGSNAALTAQEIAASPAWYPLELSGPGLVRLARLDEAAYRGASFLDLRVLQLQPQQAIVPVATLAAAASALTPRAHYIFHTGHVGSTLVSRLIGELPAFLSVREPVLLREMALAPAGQRVWGSLELRDAIGLFGRTWHPSQRAVIKASSFVSEIAARALELDTSARAILMFTPALAYLRCIMGGPNSRLESQALAASRLARLRRRLGGVPGADPRSEGEWIAMSWLCEMLCLAAAARDFASRVAWVDFDGFLAAPQEGLGAVLGALGSEACPRAMAGLLAGPVMRRYSKAPEYAYDAALREEVLAAAGREHSAQIRRGMAWLEALAPHPLVEAVLTVSPGASD